MGFGGIVSYPSVYDIVPQSHLVIDSQWQNEFSFDYKSPQENRKAHIHNWDAHLCGLAPSLSTYHMGGLLFYPGHLDNIALFVDIPR